MGTIATGVPSKGLLARHNATGLRGLDNADGEELDAPGVQPRPLERHLHCVLLSVAERAAWQSREMYASPLLRTFTFGRLACSSNLAGA